MKKNYLIISLLFSFILFGCDFFTTSLGTSARRDLSKNFSKINTNELADLITEPSMINDQEASRQLLESLGQRNDLDSLSSQQQSSVLDLLVSTSITSDTAAQVLDTLQEVSESEDGDEIDGKKIVKEILNSISDSDVAAATTILSNQDNLKNLDANSICLGAICVVAQVAKTEDVLSDEKIESIISNVETAFKSENPNVSTLVDAIIPDGSEKSRESLTAALEAINYLKDCDEEFLLGFDIFGSSN